MMQGAAFFDLDRTLIRHNSGAKWSQFLFRKGKVNFLHIARSLLWLSQYKANLLNFEQMMSYVGEQLKGKKEQEMKEEARNFIETQGILSILPQAKERIALHKRAQDPIILLSSTLSYLAEPFAHHLGIKHILCSFLEVKEGYFTGKWLGPLCYGEGKVFYAENWLQEHNLSLEGSYFYSDSFSDLPFLKKVGNPRVINPDRKLQAYAKKHQWLVEHW